MLAPVPSILRLSRLLAGSAWDLCGGCGRCCCCSTVGEVEAAIASEAAVIAAAEGTAGRALWALGSDAATSAAATSPTAAFAAAAGPRGGWRVHLVLKSSAGGAAVREEGPVRLEGTATFGPELFAAQGRLAAVVFPPGATDEHDSGAAVSGGPGDDAVGLV